MADCYVNFYSLLDPGGFQRGAQVFVGRASQAHRAAAAVGASAATPTAVVLDDGTMYAQIRPTSGSIFACIMPPGASEAELTAARVRIDPGDREVLSRSPHETSAASLYLWAV